MLKIFGIMLLALVVFQVVRVMFLDDALAGLSGK